MLADYIRTLDLNLNTWENKLFGQRQYDQQTEEKQQRAITIMRINYFSREQILIWYTGIFSAKKGELKIWTLLISDLQHVTGDV